MKNINYTVLVFLICWLASTASQAQFYPRDSFEISGKVLATSGQPMPNVRITLVGPSQTWVDSTGADGRYVFQNIPEKEDYYLLFSKNGAAKNGLNANDILLLQRHFLYLNILNPYSYYAGDVNGGFGLSTFDVVLIARLLLGYTNGFSSVPNWRFSYAYTDFDPQSPTTVNGPIYRAIDSFSIHYLESHLQNIDFVGLKTGDTDQTANPFE